MCDSIHLKAMGSFFVGGRKVSLQNQPTRIVTRGPSTSFEVNENGTYFIEQAYVQYFISENAEGTFLKIPIFRQQFEFSNFRHDFPLFRSYLGRTGSIFR